MTSGGIGLSDQSLHLLVRELLLERTQHLSGPQTAAFIDGWSSMLDLLRRTDLLLPRASGELHAAIAGIVEHIRQAQLEVLDDGTG